MRIQYKVRFFIMVGVVFLTGISYSQGKIVSPDSLMIGGIYDVFLTDGRQFVGELLSRDASGIVFDSDGTPVVLKPGQIITIRIAKLSFEIGSDLGESQPITKKFRFLGCINAGISMPTGSFDDIHKTGFSFNASIYHPFDRLMGLGAEFQYNIFPGDKYTYSDGYYYNQSESESFSIYSLKVNLIIGNLRPEDKFLIYGLFGAGMHYYSDGIVKTTFSSPYGTYFDVFAGNSGLSFLFGAGIGISYKISKKIRINGDLQYNKLPKLDYNFAYDYDSNEFDGYFSFKAGIIYAY